MRLLPVIFLLLAELAFAKTCRQFYADIGINLPENHAFTIPRIPIETITYEPTQLPDNYYYPGFRTPPKGKRQYFRYHFKNGPEHGIIVGLPMDFPKEHLASSLENIRENFSLLPNRYLPFLRFIDISVSPLTDGRALAYASQGAIRATIPTIKDAKKVASSPAILVNENREVTEADVVNSSWLFHELGHFIDFFHSGTGRCKKEWEEMKRLDGNSVSAYGDTNIGEDFAEAVKIYLLTDGGSIHPELGRTKHPNRFRFLDSLANRDITWEPFWWTP